MRRCPQCRTVLNEAHIGSARVDGCGSCGGVWFDNVELGAIANSTSTDLLALEDQFLPGGSVPELPSHKECPVCVVALFEFDFPHSPGVRLDACPKCKGIWAEDGELQALYSRMVGSAPGEATSGVETRRAGRQALGLLLSRPCAHCCQLGSD